MRWPSRLGDARPNDCGGRGDQLRLYTTLADSTPPAAPDDRSSTRANPPPRAAQALPWAESCDRSDQTAELRLRQRTVSPPDRTYGGNCAPTVGAGSPVTPTITTPVTSAAAPHRNLPSVADPRNNTARPIYDSTQTSPTRHPRSCAMKASVRASVGAERRRSRWRPTVKIRPSYDIASLVLPPPLRCSRQCGHAGRLELTSLITRPAEGPYPAPRRSLLSVRPALSVLPNLPAPSD
jgi:hypothetical protein